MENRYPVFDVGDILEFKHNGYLFPDDGDGPTFFRGWAIQKGFKFIILATDLKDNIPLKYLVKPFDDSNGEYDSLWVSWLDVVAKFNRYQPKIKSYIQYIKGIMK